MIRLVVNGVEHTVEAAADTPLLWVLRDHLGLVGTKYGCGAGLCGACTVLLDGEAVRSCSTSLSEVGERKVATIESSTPILAALQEAWVSLDVPQCGYCQSGQLMNASALLAANPKPSDGEIDAAMEGNLCRCGTYQRIRAGIRQAANKLAGETP